MAFTAKVVVMNNQPSPDGTSYIEFSPDYESEGDLLSVELNVTVEEELGWKIKSGRSYTLTLEEDNG